MVKAAQKIRLEEAVGNKRAAKPPRSVKPKKRK
jgi:hypothetical protein